MRRRINQRTRKQLVMAAAAALLLAAEGNSLGQSIIKQPGNHPRYTVEVEPHLAFGVSDPPDAGTGSGWGPGARLTFPVVHNGFVSSINNSVAIGTGLDVVFYDAEFEDRGVCTRFANTPNGTRVCVEVDNQSGDSVYYYVPVVLQWNFWLHERFSAFAEPGLALYSRQDESDDLDWGASVAIAVGGRVHLGDSFALTLRLGYPTISLGASFFL